MINVLCDRALLGAYAGGSPQVTARIARRAIREVRGKDTRHRARKRRTIELAAAVALVVALTSAIAAIPFTLWKRPAHVVAALNKAINAITDNPAATANLKRNGDLPGLSVEAADQFVRSEVASWGERVKASGAQVE